MLFARTPLTSPSHATTGPSSTSPSTSPSTSSSLSSTPHISIGFTPTGTSSLPMSVPKSPSSSSGLSCAFPSWPRGDSFQPFSSSGSGSYGGVGAPSSYISDEDLFFDEHISSSSSSDSHSSRFPFLTEAPAPPREHHLLRHVPLPPLYASDATTTSSTSGQKKRRRSSRKDRRSSRPMTTIAETPETTE